MTPTLLDYPDLCLMFRLYVEKFGVDIQLNTAIEEMAELIHAIARLRRAEHLEDQTAIYNAKMHLIDELADVLIILGQVRFIIEDNWFQSTKLHQTVKEKILRAEERLMKGGFP